MTTASSLSWLPNLWEIMYLKMTPPVRMWGEDLAEVYLMGFQPFAPGVVGNSTPTSLSEAAERPTSAPFLSLAVNCPAHLAISPQLHVCTHSRAERSRLVHTVFVLLLSLQFASLRVADVTYGGVCTVQVHHDKLLAPQRWK